MKIAYLTDEYEPEINGVVTSIMNFTTALAAAGHEILIIAPKYNKKKDAPRSNIQVKRYAAFSLSSNKNTRIAYPLVTSIMSDLKNFAPDIVHVQTPLSIGITGVWAARLLDLKCIQTYHGYIPDLLVYASPYNLLGINRATEWVASSKAFRALMESELVSAIGDMGDDHARSMAVVKGLNSHLERMRKKPGQVLSERFAWDFTRFLYNRSDVVLTPSVSLARLLKKHRLKAPVMALSNGIDFSSFSKKKDYTLTNKYIHVGRLGLDGKNVDVIIRGLAIALKSNDKVFLDIIGDGPARGSLERLVSDLRVGQNVNFMGFCPNSTLKKAYKDYDAFITASTMETQGLVILEAMAAGLPIIGVDALAVPELVHDGENGYLVEPKNPKQMAEAMLKLTEGPTRNKQFGQKSLEMAAVHDLPNCAAKLERVYADLIASTKANKK